MLDSIYKNVTLLEDMQFLIKYATTVLPPSPADDAGEMVWENILTLQNELTGNNLPLVYCFTLISLAIVMVVLCACTELCLT